MWGIVEITELLLFLINGYQWYVIVIWIASFLFRSELILSAQEYLNDYENQQYHWNYDEET